MTLNLIHETCRFKLLKIRARATKTLTDAHAKNRKRAHAQNRII